MGTAAAAMTGNRWRLAAVVLAMLLVAAVVVGAVLWRSDRSDLADLEHQRSDEAAATRAAEAITTSWLTYDYRSYDDTWVADNGTDAFQQEYDAAARGKLVEKAKLVSRGRVVESAATWQKDGQVEVILFTDQTLTDPGIRRAGKPALHSRSGVELTMVHEHGEWLVDDLVQLQFE